MTLLVQKFCGEFVSGYFKTKKEVLFFSGQALTPQKENFYFLRLPLYSQPFVGLVHQLTLKISERKARLAPIIKVRKHEH